MFDRSGQHVFYLRLFENSWLNEYCKIPFSLAMIPLRHKSLPIKHLQ